MKLLRNNVLGDKKVNCFKATQVLGCPTDILIWVSKIAKSATRKIKGGSGASMSRGNLNLGDAYEPQWCHVTLNLLKRLHKSWIYKSHLVKKETFNLFTTE